MRIIAMPRESWLNSEIDPIVVMSEMTQVLLLEMGRVKGKFGKGLAFIIFFDCFCCTNC